MAPNGPIIIRLVYGMSHTLATTWTMPLSLLMVGARVGLVAMTRKIGHIKGRTDGV